MKIFLLLAIVFFTEPNFLFGQDSQIIMNDKPFKNKRFYVMVGGNFTSFQDLKVPGKSNGEFGGLYGFIYLYSLNENIYIDFSSFISLQKVTVKDRPTAYSFQGFLHRVFYKHDISLLFIELPVSVNYKLWSNSFLSINLGIGAGYSISIKDYSKKGNILITEEIIGEGPPLTDPLGGETEDSVFQNSGYVITSNIELIIDSFIVKVIYLNNRNNIYNQMGKSHVFSFQFGYCLN